MTRLATDWPLVESREAWREWATVMEKAMWTKKSAMDEATRGEGCLGKARDDEPVFIIVGDDVTMAKVVRFWAQEVDVLNGGVLTLKTREARMFAHEIDKYQEDNPNTTKIPD